MHVTAPSPSKNTDASGEWVRAGHSQRKLPSRQPEGAGDTSGRAHKLQTLDE